MGIVPDDPVTRTPIDVTTARRHIDGRQYVCLRGRATETYVLTPTPNFDAPGLTPAADPPRTSHKWARSMVVPTINDLFDMYNKAERLGMVSHECRSHLPGQIVEILNSVKFDRIVNDMMTDMFLDGSLDAEQPKKYLHYAGKCDAMKVALNVSLARLLQNGPHVPPCAVIREVRSSRAKHSPSCPRKAFKHMGCVKSEDAQRKEQESDDFEDSFEAVLSQPDSLEYEDVVGAQRKECMDNNNKNDDHY